MNAMMWIGNETARRRRRKRLIRRMTPRSRRRRRRRPLRGRGSAVVVVDDVVEFLDEVEAVGVGVGEPVLAEHGEEVFGGLDAEAVLVGASGRGRLGGQVGEARVEGVEGGGGVDARGLVLGQVGGDGGELFAHAGRRPRRRFDALLRAALEKAAPEKGRRAPRGKGKDRLLLQLLQAPVLVPQRRLGLFLFGFFFFFSVEVLDDDVVLRGLTLREGRGTGRSERGRRGGDELGLERQGGEDEVDEVEGDGLERELGLCHEVRQVREGGAPPPRVVVRGPRVHHEPPADLLDVGRGRVAAAPDRARQRFRDAGLGAAAASRLDALQCFPRREERHELQRVRVRQRRQRVRRREVHVRLVVAQRLHARRRHGLPVPRRRQRRRLVVVVVFEESGVVAAAESVEELRQREPAVAVEVEGREVVARRKVHDVRGEARADD
mmetsp:Transcript_3460/g.10592  ORF Transcript_3460/g.10592 Transcript_3460/m.10592 type:complete len:437 (+) Transcript_3460:877-2187(+)